MAHARQNPQPRRLTLPTAVAAASAAAEVIAETIAGGQRLGQAVHLALAGGSTPRSTYELLADQVRDWRDVHLWLSDERHLPWDHPDSNHRMISAALRLTSGDAGPTLHGVSAGGTLAADCDAYEAAMRDQMPNDDATGLPRLDLALLGLGEDGHTASLFPDHPALTVEGRCCVGVTDAPKPPPERVSLTLPLLSGATRLVVLATGAGKAVAVEAMLAGPSPSTPASLLPMARTTLICDRAAAGLREALPGDGEAGGS